MLVTVDTSHFDRSPLNAAAQRNMEENRRLASDDRQPTLIEPSVIPYGHDHNNQAKAKNKPEKKKGSNARSKLVTYGKLVRRVSDARVTRKLDQEVVERKRKHCEAAYKRQLTATVGNRKAARKAYVKAGREFDLILKGSVSV